MASVADAKHVGRVFQHICVGTVTDSHDVLRHCLAAIGESIRCVHRHDRKANVLVVVEW